MRFAPLSEFIVPLIFVAIWAVTWVLNRESQPLAPRPRLREEEEREGSGTNFANVGPGVGGLRSPSPGPALGGPLPGRPLRPTDGGRPLPRPFERSVSPEMTLRSGETMILSDARSEYPDSRGERPTPSRAPRAPQNRRSGRGKGGAGQARQRSNVESSTPRELTQQISSSMSQVKGKTLELTHLNLPLTPLQSLPLPQTGVSFLPPSAPVPKVAVNSGIPLDLVRTLADPARLREVFIWNELLQPPVALRRGPLAR